MSIDGYIKRIARLAKACLPPLKTKGDQTNELQARTRAVQPLQIH